MDQKCIAADRRRTARVNFRPLPGFWMDFTGEVFEAKCINLSATGISFKISHPSITIEPGTHFETALTAPRLCVVATGSVVRMRPEGREVLISAQFDQEPDQIKELISAALSCTDEEFSAGSITTRDNILKACGIFSGTNAGDLRHNALSHRLLDMSEVRDIDDAGMNLLIEAQQQYGLRIIHCKPTLSYKIRSRLGRTLCADLCQHCSAEH